MCALFDARRGEVYAGCYRFGHGPLEVLLEPVALPLATVLERVAPLEPLFVGDGAVRYAARLPAAAVPPLLTPPRAAALLWLQELDPEAGRVREVAGWEPAYLRDSGAEQGLRA
ncbi:MAG: hypothetical protein FIB01_05200 [Gemmatimonadetes bacterium]|nr:hypothetical protein [Gemmatimonadota bacterium]